MLARRAKIVLCACVAACAGVWWNVMYLQQGTRADILARTQRLGETARRSPPPALIEPGKAHPTVEIPSVASVIPEPEIDADVVRAVQRELALRGYEPGPADGLIHPVTRAAVMAYEHDHGLPLTARPSEEILKSILFGVPADASGKVVGEPQPQAQEIIRSVQESLAGLGYPISKVDGRMSEETVRAIRAFEAKNDLTPSGRVSGALLLKLRDVAVARQRRASAR